MQATPQYCIHSWQVLCFFRSPCLFSIGVSILCRIVQGAPVDSSMLFITSFPRLLVGYQIGFVIINIDGLIDIAMPNWPRINLIG